MDTNVTPDPSLSTEQQNASASPETLDANGQRSSQPHAGQLSPLLVWAVVFCDIGTSVYYVPGILYAQVGALTPLSIAATIIGFIPLALKYQEICWRNPEGGGVVFVATKAFTPRWGVNIFEKPHATLFGGALIATGMVISVTAQQGWFSDLWYQIPFIARAASQRISAAELETEEIPNLISLSEAHEIMTLYPSRTLVAMRGRNLRLIEEAITREKGLNGNAIYVLYVEERPGLFVGSEAREPSSESRETLRFAAKTAQQRGFELIPIWTISYNAAEAIARAARVLAVDTVMMGVSRRNAVYHLLRGHVVNGLTRRLPQSCHLLLHS